MHMGLICTDLLCFNVYDQHEVLTSFSELGLQSKIIYCKKNEFIAKLLQVNLTKGKQAHSSPVIIQCQVMFIL